MTLTEHFRAALPLNLVRDWSLLLQLVRREVEARYRGSFFGIVWSLATPVLMLAVFTFVFSTIFTVRWGVDAPDRGHFALMLFPGMVLNAFFAEVLTRAPGLIVANPNFVKKVVFPLDLLSAVAVGSALVQALLGLAVVVAFQWVLRGSVPATALWLPLVVAPFVVVLLGVGWLLSSLGVYVRDLGHVAGVAATVLMFMSPVFYPVEALPPEWRPMVHLSPLTLPIEQTRAVLLLGRMPDFAALGAYATAGLAFALGSLYWFQRARKGFADVL